MHHGSQTAALGIDRLANGPVNIVSGTWFDSPRVKEREGGDGEWRWGGGERQTDRQTET